MITIASRQHLQGIKELWREAFGGDDAYTDMFLAKGVQPDNMLVYLQGETVCGMLFILPCKLVFGELSYKCAYLYAIATGEQYRGHGISTALLNATYDLCDERGYHACALVPASASLFDFYAKRGYATQGYVRQLSIGCGQLTATKHSPVLSSVTVGEIMAMRKNAFGGAYLEWDERTLEYIADENKSQGGDFYRYDYDGDTGLVSCLPSGDSLLIREFSGNSSTLEQVAGGLHSIYHKDNYVFRLSNTSDVGVLTPLAMTRWIKDGTAKPFYLSHVLE